MRYILFVVCVIFLVIVTGCTTQTPHLTYSTTPQVTKTTSVTSSSGTNKSVGVSVSKIGITWLGGRDMGKIVSWEAKSSDGSVKIQGTSAPLAGDFYYFNQDIEGKNITVTAKFSDGHEQVLLST